MTWFRRTATPISNDPFDPNHPLLHLPKRDVWRIKDSYEGVQILGQTGSGKTTGSGHAIAKAFLSAGYGGLVLCAKTDERELWERWCRATNRLDDLAVISARGRHTFNFLEHELRRSGAGAGLVLNLVQMFRTVFEVTSRGGGKSGGGEDAGYWKSAVDQLLAHALELLSLATGRLAMHELYQLVLSAPQSEAQVRDSAWQANSFCMRCVVRAKNRKLTGPKSKDLDFTCRYWLVEYPALSPKTRSIIVNMVTGMMDGFLRSPFRELFSGETTITPEETFRSGRVILVDLPIKEYDAVGRYAQILIKYCFQRAVERRSLDEHPRPVFLWADECQFFVTSLDREYQATARSKRGATVYLTQNLPSLVAELGGESARSAVTALLGNLGTMICHANSCHETNKHCAEIIGRSAQDRFNASSNFGSRSNNDGMTAGSSESMDWDVEPRVFTTLAKGGPENDLCVEGVLFQGGRIWRATRKTYVRVGFAQETKQ